MPARTARPPAPTPAVKASDPSVGAAAKASARAAARIQAKVDKAAAATPLARTRRARKITAELAVEFPGAVIELDFSTPLELAVATILSAQSTDVRVNLVTPALFARYRTAADYAGANRMELEEMVKSTGFFRNKTSSLIGLGQALVERFDGVVPPTMDELTTLPGFGRKTANVILGNAFGKPGLTVDTHVGRLVRRWGLTVHTDPVRVESEIGEMLPAKDWTMFSHRTIYHGRRVCHAKKPACGACALAAWCPSYGTGPTDPLAAAPLVKGAERPHLLQLAGIEPDTAPPEDLTVAE